MLSKKTNIPFSWNFFGTRLKLAEKYLLENDRVGACALAGAVIETSLRKIIADLNLPYIEQKRCPVCGMNQSNDRNIFAYLQKFKKIELLDNKMLQLLDECRQIRNTASHGYFGELRQRDCIRIIKVADSLLKLGRKNF